MKRSRSSLPQSPGKPEYLTPKSTTAGIPTLTPDVYRFLKAMLEPSKLDHQASHADMIRNVVLEDLGRRVDAIYNQSRN